MAIKTISTYVAAGYVLAQEYNALKITTKGGVGGFGLKLKFGASVVNGGTIRGSGAGITAYADVRIQNLKRGLIQGYDGAVASVSARITNLGHVIATGAHGEGIDLQNGGTLFNGSSSDNGALINSAGGGVQADGAPVDVENFGQIEGAGAVGVLLNAGGTVTNGSLTDTSASIGGYGGVAAQNDPAVVVNFATIGTTIIAPAVLLKDGGTITNGGATDTAALLVGGVRAENVAATISNFGSINGPDLYGVYLESGGVVTNGSNGDTNSVISGLNGGVFVESGAAEISNYGTVSGFGFGMIFHSDAKITNGSNTDTLALVSAYHDIYTWAVSTVTNYGTIHGDDLDGNGVGIGLFGGGQVTNGSASDTRAFIAADGTVVTAGAVATITNYGTIACLTRGEGDGVLLLEGGVFTNGSASDITALLSNCCASVFGTATIANFGTIQGNVDLSGVGKITNFGTILAHADSGGGILINGSASDTTAYCGYGEMHGGAVVNYATIGNTLIAEFGALVSAGATLTNGSVTDMVALIYGYTGVLAYSSSTVTNLAKVEGRGRGVSLYNSTFVNGSASNTAASVDAYGDGVQALRDFVTIANFATIVGTVSHGVDVWYGGNIVNGTVSDTAAVIEGKMGVYLKGPGTLTNFGTITGTGGTAVELRSGADVLVVEAGSAFGGAVIGHSSTIVLASGTGTLSGLGGGDVTVSGSMVTTTFTSFKIVEIGAGGHFTASGSATIDSGDSLIDVGGQLTLDVLTNNGALTVKGGSLTVAGPVTGSGVATLNTGAISFGSSFSQNVSFVGSQGMLQLADSRDYAATITGFSTNGRTSLDLGDISFVSASEATFSGTATSGVLTVTDGTRTARITLMGNYLSSPFAASSDGHGGVIVVASSPAAFVAAMAGLATSAPANSYAKTTPTGSESLLASPKWAGLH